MRIEHVAMYVEDLEKTKEFFIKYFDAAAGEQYYNPKTEFQSYFLSFWMEQDWRSCRNHGYPM